MSATSTLYAIVRKRPWKKQAEPRQFTLSQGRRSMVVVGLVGLLIGYAVELIPGFGLKYLWWFLNTIGACVVVPTILSLFWSRLSARGILTGSVIGLVVGLPLVAFGSIKGYDHLLAATYVGIIIVSTLSCLLTAKDVAPSLLSVVEADAT